MFKAATAAATLLTSSVVNAGGDHSVWCLNKNEKYVRGIKTNSEEWSKNSATTSFRGRYSEFSLFVEDEDGILEGCEVFKDYIHGDDGMWIIEEPTREEMEKTMTILRDANYPIYYEGDLSFIVGG